MKILTSALLAASLSVFTVSAQSTSSDSPVVSGPAPTQSTIADIVVSVSGGANAGQFDSDNTDFDILLTALQTANLVGAVSDPNANLTVFAPNDLAFIRLANDLGYAGSDESGSWDFLVMALTGLGGGNPIPVLTDVLLYHVVGQQVSFVGVIFRSFFGLDITTLQGATITPRFFRLEDQDPDLQDPRFIQPINLRTANGIIHGIDRVLIPTDL